MICTQVLLRETQTPFKQRTCWVDHRKTLEKDCNLTLVDDPDRWYIVLSLGKTVEVPDEKLLCNFNMEE